MLSNDQSKHFCDGLPTCLGGEFYITVGGIKPAEWQETKQLTDLLSVTSQTFLWYNRNNACIVKHYHTVSTARRQQISVPRQCTYNYRQACYYCYLYFLLNRLFFRVRTIHKKTGPDRFSNFCDLDRPSQYLVQ